MPFVTVLETDDNHDGLIDTFDIQARALAAATEQRRLLDPLSNIGRSIATYRTAGGRPFHTAGLRTARCWSIHRPHRPTRRCTPVLPSHTAVCLTCPQ